MPLKVSLQSLGNRPGIITACEQWRQRVTSNSHLRDVYDGQVWHDFHSFLSRHIFLRFNTNVNWFQTFLETQYFVGAIYLTI